MDQFWSDLVQRLKGGKTSASNPASDAERDAARIWEMAKRYKEAAYTPDTDAHWARFKERMQEEPAINVRALSRKRLRRVLTAAAAVALLAVAAWAAWEAGPGRTYLLSNSAAHGAAIVYQLPDGSKAWLNHRSSLTYKSDWAFRSKREVRLRGEAFFIVASNPDKPFTVYTDKGVVEVLGTQFNVRDYPEEPLAEVEVAEGKVAFGNKTGVRVPLEKHMRATLGTGQSVAVTATEAPSAGIWRTGTVQCLGVSLARISELLQRHELGKLHFADPRLANCTVTGPLETKNLQASLELLCQAAGLNLKPQGKNAFAVSGKPCR